MSSHLEFARRKEGKNGGKPGGTWASFFVPYLAMADESTASIAESANVLSPK